MKKLIYLFLVLFLSSCEYYSEMVEVPVRDIEGRRFAVYKDGWVKEVSVKDTTVFVDCKHGSLTNNFLVIKANLINVKEIIIDGKAHYHQTFSNGKYYFIIKHFPYKVEKGTFLVDKENIYSHSNNKRIDNKKVYSYYLNKEFAKGF
jgi:hypothetical protein